MKTYKPNKIYNLVNALILISIIFFGLTLPALQEDALSTGKIAGLSLFWFLAIVISIKPFAFKLEVGESYVKIFFLGFCIRNLKSTNIQSFEYGNLFRGGLGYGMGLKGWEKKNGKNKYFSIGEKMWGKEAIQDIKRALSRKV